MRVTSWTMLIGCCSAAGIPLFAGFWSKDGIMAGVFASENPVFIAVAVLITFFSALYTFRLLLCGLHREPAKRRAFEVKRIHESNATILLPLAVLAVPAALVGFVAIPGSRQAFDQFIFYGRRPELEAINAIAIGVSLLATAAGVVVAAVYYWPRFQAASAQAFNRRFPYAYAWAHNKGYFDEIYEAMFVRGLLLTAGRGTQWFDTHVIDGFTDGLAQGYMVIGSRLRRLQTGRVQAYALGLFAGVFVLSVIFLIFSAHGPPGGGGDWPDDADGPARSRSPSPPVTLPTPTAPHPGPRGDPLGDRLAAAAGRAGGPPAAQPHRGRPGPDQERRRGVHRASPCCWRCSPSISTFTEIGNFTYTGDFKYIDDLQWFGAFGAHYKVGVDGLSLPMVLLSTLLFFVATWRR